MDNLEGNREKHDASRSAIKSFSDAQPYPPPVEDLDGYCQRWQVEVAHREDFHLHWPGKAYRMDLNMLIAGCGTSQAGRHALRQPASQIVGIDASATNVRYTETLKCKYNLTILEIYQLPIEQVSTLGCQFEKIIFTGVLHHLANPILGLRILRDVLVAYSAMNLTVYATYRRIGVSMLQEYCRWLGIGHSNMEIKDLANSNSALPRTHPLALLLGESSDFTS